MPDLQIANARRRIIESAASLFSQKGYHGTSTREIAIAGHVNAVTIFRHFPCKRDLYTAALESEISKVKLRGDLLVELADASDVRAALVKTLELVKVAFGENPHLLRLLYFSALEFEEDLEPLLRKHLREPLGVVSNYLQRWIDNGQLGCGNARTVVLMLVVIVLNYNPLLNAFSKALPALAATLDAHAEVYQAICRNPVSG